MSCLEVWIFSPREEFKPRGGVVAIEVAPPSYGASDAEMLARRIRDDYLAKGLEVTTIVRSDRSY